MDPEVASTTMDGGVKDEVTVRQINQTTKKMDEISYSMEDSPKSTIDETRKLKRKRKKMEEGKAMTKFLDKGNQLSLYAQIKKSKTKGSSKKGGERELEYQTDISSSSEDDEVEEDVIDEENDVEVDHPSEEENETNKKDKKDKKYKKIRKEDEQTKDQPYATNRPQRGTALDRKNDQITPSDYEKLLMSEKNNSAIWISYIAYYIEKGNLEDARKIAERALKNIDIHKVEEKRNIFFCYINMECIYGNKLRDIFKRALLCCNEKSVYIHTTNVLKINKKFNELKELCEESIKKFRYSKKIWSHYLEIIHSTFNDEKYAHEILLKSLHSLAKKKHLSMIINAARFEYKYSNKERGKSYFEKLIQEYPKRSDVWFTYLDIHINSLTKNDTTTKKKKLNTNELQFVRNIFERFISFKFKTRVMKMIFTKWLVFEKNHGTVASQKMVQQKAYKYVESLNSLS
ncbi:rRNA biogenesis protein RRP5 [Plasmodium gonderi]|uniref:rRNA biogenesis protein RRP5 n=1 Tax=Plasmodium gonderi TaxID=77519 RepID=A0A1Y1JKW6_PLAGO|nr:rRNA biogenesis protein RRP5 [Plasmodium gonderi]GAW83169.1 rRNA biogenesis protein RRP5 [Plasmodium gonderi]